MTLPSIAAVRTPGRLAQLVRALPSHGRGQRFKSFVAHHFCVLRQQIFYRKFPMSTLFRAIEFLCLSLWLGSDVFLSFVVAPGAFRVLAPNRDQAGAIVGFSLTRMHLGGIALGAAFLLVRLVRTRSFAS